MLCLLHEVLVYVEEQYKYFKELNVIATEHTKKYNDITAKISKGIDECTKLQTPKISDKSMGTWFVSTLEEKWSESGVVDEHIRINIPQQISYTKNDVNLERTLMHSQIIDIQEKSDSNITRNIPERKLVLSDVDMVKINDNLLTPKESLCIKDPSERNKTFKKTKKISFRANRNLLNTNKLPPESIVIEKAIVVSPSYKNKSPDSISQTMQKNKSASDTVEIEGNQSISPAIALSECSIEPLKASDNQQSVESSSELFSSTFEDISENSRECSSESSASSTSPDKKKSKKNPKHQKELFECKICLKTFNRKSWLLDHEITHSNTQAYICELCGSKYKRKNNLDRHMKIHSGKKPYECHLCGKSFAIQDYLSKHLQSHESGSEKVKKFMCDFCGESFSSKLRMNEHTSKHTGASPFECTICNKAFCYRSSLRNHIKTHSLQRFECKLCDKAFKSKFGLKAHSVTHTGEKPYSCGICDAKFSTPFGRTVHKSSVHTPANHFKCTQCEKTFNRKENLKKHLYLHTGVKPFACGVCGKKFARKRDCKKHQLIHSKING